MLESPLPYVTALKVDNGLFTLPSAPGDVNRRDSDVAERTGLLAPDTGSRGTEARRLTLQPSGLVTPPVVMYLETHSCRRMKTCRPSRVAEYGSGQAQVDTITRAGGAI